MIAKIWTPIVLYDGKNSLSNRPQFGDDYPDIDWSDSVGFPYVSEDGAISKPETELIEILVTATSEQLALIAKDDRYFINWMSDGKEDYAGAKAPNQKHSIDEVAQMQSFLVQYEIKSSLVTDLMNQPKRETASEVFKAAALADQVVVDQVIDLGGKT